jgi:hypothetical protein
MTATSCVPSSLPYAATVVLCGGFLDFGAYSSWFWTHLSTQLRSRGFNVVVVTPSPVGSLHDRSAAHKLPMRSALLQLLSLQTIDAGSCRRGMEFALFPYSGVGSFTERSLIDLFILCLPMRSQTELARSSTS